MAYRDGETVTIGAHQVYFYKSDAGHFMAEIRQGSEEIDADHITSYEAAALVGLLGDDA
ncbi:hypothetical protein ACFY2K_26155 [Kitasatospora sp. NPDC001309]|uniref:hypothetical protein n=1 Tax=Kitasatospora sp. NPDC001309 TaxID=3364013 RepID=UPI00369D7E96